jgi:hypothetical protein
LAIRFIPGFPVYWFPDFLVYWFPDLLPYRLTTFTAKNVIWPQRCSALAAKTVCRGPGDAFDVTIAGGFFQAGRDLPCGRHFRLDFGVQFGQNQLRFQLIDPAQYGRSPFRTVPSASTE